MAFRALGLVLVAPLCTGVPRQAGRQKDSPAHHHVHSHHSEHHHIIDDGAVTAGKCSQCPHHSDVIATSRFPHFAPYHGPYSTWGAMEAFHATRMDWVYTTNATFVQEARRRGLELTLAMNPQTADAPDKTTFDIGRVLNIHGKPLVAPWMRSWGGPQRSYGCVNNPDFLQIQYAFGSSLLEIGSGGIQHDDPAANGEAVTWNKGDPALSGCYCEHCMAGFTKALMAGALSKSERTELNITAAFNYRELLLREQWNGTSTAVKILRPLFVAYQMNVTSKYLVDLRQHLHAKAAELGRTTSLSCNNGGHVSRCCLCLLAISSRMCLFVV